MSRTWSLSGAGDHLHAVVQVTNSAAAPLSQAIDEVIPKSVAPDVATVRFAPVPDQIVNRDPVVRYQVKDLAAEHAVEFDYDIAVPAKGSAIARMRAWADDQQTALLAFSRAPGNSSTPIPATLIRLTVSPDHPSLAVGQSYQLSPQGVMSDGSSASAVVLSAVAWTASDPSVLSVADGRVTGIAGGTATVTAQAGSLESSDPVTVVTDAQVAAAGAATTTLPAPVYTPPSIDVQGPSSKVGAPQVASGPTPASGTPGTQSVGSNTVGCPDGSTVRTGSACPTAPPNTLSCGGGSFVPAGSTCPTTSTQTQQYICPDGSVVASPSKCSPPPTSPRPPPATTPQTAPQTQPQPVPQPQPAPQPQPPSQPPPPRDETTGGVTHTWTNYSERRRKPGPKYPFKRNCLRVLQNQGFRVADGDTWWYRIASGPWNNSYFAWADAFYNNGQTSGSLHGTPFVDGAVADC